MLKSLFRRADPREAMAPLYRACVATARAEHWYLAGAVPDTIDGRFDMLAAVLSVVLVRLESQGASREGVMLTELFVDDMDGNLRQIGIGDLIVGKHIGRMMSALGGRIGAYRAALEAEDRAALEEALARNLYRDDAPAPAALTHVAERIEAFWAGVSASQVDALIAGRLPQ